MTQIFNRSLQDIYEQYGAIFMHKSIPNIVSFILQISPDVLKEKYEVIITHNNEKARIIVFEKENPLGDFLRNLYAGEE